MVTEFNLDCVHSSWRQCIEEALKKMDPDYIQLLLSNWDWLPGHEKIFNAFSLPVTETRYVLFGESPYPRQHSANGFAFWDAAVTDLWSAKGLSTKVNRATSLRNIIKMLLIAEGKLSQTDTSQQAIAALDKTDLIKTNSELFTNLIKHGFLLLNATPVLQTNQVRKDAKAWKPFLKHILDFLLTQKTDVQFLLLGNIANQIEPYIKDSPHKKIYSEHPYNISFINNTVIIDFFRPFHLLLPFSP